MKKFRIKNLTVPVGKAVNIRACGPTWSCPAGPAGSFCHFSNGCGFVTNGCPGNSIYCNFSSGCGFGAFTVGCYISGGGCGINYSTLPPTDYSRLINEVELATDKLELIDVLKADLTQAIQKLDDAGAQVSHEATPQSLDEANEVEAQLQSALKEVQALKKKLK